jgi:glycyl-tRNA synthetase beta chain
MRDARARYQGSDAEKKFSADDKFSESTKTFFRERLEFFLRDVKGFSYDVVNAVLAVGENDVVDALRRAEAVKSVAAMPEFQAIGAACKRIRNILRQAGEKKIQPSTKFDALQASAPEEKQLAAFMERTLPSVEELRAQENYSDALLALSTAREPVDAFFDKVMVMVDDERIRANRLALLQTLLQQFSTIADFSEIVSDGKTS